MLISPVETRSLQKDHEALAIIWAAEHFRLYMLGRDFTVLADDKLLAMASLFSILERLMLRKQAFSMKVVYMPGSGNAAGYLSRHPSGDPDKPLNLGLLAQVHVNFIAKAAPVTRLSSETIAIEYA